MIYKAEVRHRRPKNARMRAVDDSVAAVKDGAPDGDMSTAYKPLCGVRGSLLRRHLRTSGPIERSVMKASEIMTKRVISIEPEATIVQAIKLMLKNHLSGLPVIDGSGNLVGIITEGDFLHRREIGTELKRNAWLDAIFGPEQSAQDYVRSHGIRVAELMTRPPITVDADTSLDKVVHLMERHYIKRLPVLRKGKVVGIISRANLMRALASIHRASSKTSQNDQEIRKRLVADIEKQNWAYGADVMVLVRDGAVDLCGTLNDSSQRGALKALVREKSGVRKLYDHLRLKDEGISVS